MSDVGPSNGPHSYIEGSHIDELFTFGVPFSARIEDKDVAKYYSADRIKTLCGPAGTLAFGDTSCVHKGTNVEAGYRIRLQFEYASSLYLSPVSPFNEIDPADVEKLGVLPPCVPRLLANYDSSARLRFATVVQASRVAERRLLNRVVSRAKREISAFRARRARADTPVHSK